MLIIIYIYIYAHLYVNIIICTISLWSHWYIYVYLYIYIYIHYIYIYMYMCNIVSFELWAAEGTRKARVFRGSRIIFIGRSGNIQRVNIIPLAQSGLLLKLPSVQKLKMQQCPSTSQNSSSSDVHLKWHRNWRRHERHQATSDRCSLERSLGWVPDNLNSSPYPADLS